MRIRLRDIAERLNVSVVTVSKVLRDQSDISPETKARVLKVMRELNYRPNIAARTLATGRTWSIGLIVPSLVHPFFAEVADGIVEVLEPAGYGLFISSSAENPEREVQQIEHQISRQVDALMIASCHPDGAAILEQKGATLPLILIDRYFRGFKTNFVGVRDEWVGAQATEYLLNTGVSRVAHIRGPNISTADGRFNGYMKALAARGIPFDSSLVRQVDSGEQTGEVSGAEAMRSLLSLSEKPDAVFCFNDPIAAGALDAILQAGLRVPEDISVMGCGNTVWSKFLRVPLSTVDQNAKAIGARAAQLALDLIAGAQVSKRSNLVKAHIIPRASTRPLQQAVQPALAAPYEVAEPA